MPTNDVIFTTRRHQRPSNVQQQPTDAFTYVFYSMVSTIRVQDTFSLATHHLRHIAANTNRQHENMLDFSGKGFGCGLAAVVEGESSRLAHRTLNVWASLPLPVRTTKKIT